MPEKALLSGGPGEGAKMQPGGLQEDAPKMEVRYLLTAVVSGYRA